MEWVEDRIKWVADGKPVQIGLTRTGTGPGLLLLPALSSISTRKEMRALQERLAAHYSTVAIDWPGFGDLPRPKVVWRPDLYRDFLRFVLAEVIQPDVTVAAGHATGYALAQVAEDPASAGHLCLLAPTWRGPLPTMAGQRLSLFRWLAHCVDLPLAGATFYRFNVNRPVIEMMARGHVYSDPAWLTADKMTEKRVIIEAPGARYASFRFVAGQLDPFPTREVWLDTARHVPGKIALLYGASTPRKSKAEMAALAGLENVSATVLLRGKLSFYEEYPDDTAKAVLNSLV
jgi:pimeloyl-ACP methyl ester carboxylesterase